jgi:hypothetical protein
MPDVSEAFLLNGLDLSLRTVPGETTREAICRVLLVRPARVLGISRLFRGNSWDFAGSVFPPQSSVFPAKVLTTSRRSRVGGLDFRSLGQAAYRSRVAHSKRFPSPQPRVDCPLVMLRHPRPLIPKSAVQSNGCAVARLT